MCNLSSIFGWSDCNIIWSLWASNIYRKWFEHPPGLLLAALINDGPETNSWRTSISTCHHHPCQTFGKKTEMEEKHTNYTRVTTNPTCPHPRSYALDLHGCNQLWYHVTTAFTTCFAKLVNMKHNAPCKLLHKLQAFLWKQTMQSFLAFFTNPVTVVRSGLVVFR